MFQLDVLEPGACISLFQLGSRPLCAVIDDFAHGRPSHNTATPVVNLACLSYFLHCGAKSPGLELSPRPEQELVTQCSSGSSYAVVHSLHSRRQSRFTLSIQAIPRRELPLFRAKSALNSTSFMPNGPLLSSDLINACRCQSYKHLFFPTKTSHSSIDT